MPRKAIDPAQLEGEALRRWYLRTPQEIDAERQAAADQRHEEYFSPRQSNQDPAAAQIRPQNAALSEDDVLWMPNGRGGYRAIKPRGGETWFGSQRQTSAPDALPFNPAAPEVAELIDVGNPENARLKREYIKKYGSWPQTADGKDYDVSHIRAIADGGSNTLDNIEPMDPVEHRAKHKRDGDGRRFGKRAGIARAFGGRVEPPLHSPGRVRGPVVRGLGLWGMIPNITGLLSGRIRTDSFDNFSNDMLGYPSQEDIRDLHERRRRQHFPNSKPGDLVA